MIKTTFKSAALSLLIGIGAIAAAPATAEAGQYYFEFGGHGPHAGYRDYRGHRFHHRHFDRRRVCTPRRAVRKAARMGLRHAHIARVKPRRIVVKGWDHGYRTPRRLCPRAALSGASLALT